MQQRPCALKHSWLYMIQLFPVKNISGKHMYDKCVRMCQNLEKRKTYTQTPPTQNNKLLQLEFLTKRFNLQSNNY